MVEWKVLGESVRGASHIRNDLPNQDAFEICENPLIIAVADGHGSAKCPYSDLGAQFAVASGIEAIQQIISKHSPPSEILSFLASKDILNELIPKNIYKLWKSKVDDDINADSITIIKDDECSEIITIDKVENAESPESESIKKESPPSKKDYLQYGATLLIVCIIENSAFFWQIGDGDLVVIHSDGSLDEPIPIDNRLLGNETTSLCRINAWQDFRSYVMPIINKPPKAIFLVTDGYKNSFKEPEGFDKALDDIYSFIQTDGEDSVKDNLADWLNEASQSGSGDDITLVLAYSVDSPNISMECISEDV